MAVMLAKICQICGLLWIRICCTCFCYFFYWCIAFSWSHYFEKLFVSDVHVLCITFAFSSTMFSLIYITFAFSSTIFLWSTLIINTVIISLVFSTFFATINSTWIRHANIIWAIEKPNSNKIINNKKIMKIN